MTHMTKPISPLRQRMIDDMTLRTLSPKTFRRGGRSTPLRDGRVPRWVVGGRRYQIVPKRTLGIFTEQLKMTPEDWT
jgi:hypothetical protein